jgi:hypothetical protein
VRAKTASRVATAHHQTPAARLHGGGPDLDRGAHVCVARNRRLSKDYELKVGKLPTFAHPQLGWSINAIPGSMRTCRQQDDLRFESSVMNFVFRESAWRWLHKIGCPSQRTPRPRPGSSSRQVLAASLNVKLLGRLIASDLRRFPAHDLISLHDEIQRQ